MFSPQAMTPDELQWLFHQVREACVSPVDLVTPRGIETALQISRQLAAAAVENQLSFRELRVQAGTNWTEAAVECPASLRPDIDAIGAVYRVSMYGTTGDKAQTGSVTKITIEKQCL